MTHAQEPEAQDDLERAQMSTEEINDLPDDAFGYIEPGGHKDESGKTVPRSLRHFPLHDAAHVRNAMARMGQSPFGDKARAKIMAAAKKMGIGMMAEDESRSEAPPANEILRYERTWALDDIFIQRGGDGRTVTAYAAVFDIPAEVTDQHGHYIEEIDRAAFNRDLARSKPQGGRDYWLVNCFYNHGMDLSGKANHMLSVPLGSPLDIHPDGKGLLTITRYNKSELADSVLESIKNGDIRSQSFRGRIFKSNPDRPSRYRTGGGLATIRRTELGLGEYGPTPAAVYAGAEVVAVRAEKVAAALAELSEAEKAQLIRMLEGGPSGDPQQDTVASAVELDAEDPPIVRSEGNKDKIAAILGDLRTQGVL